MAPMLIRIRGRDGVKADIKMRRKRTISFCLATGCLLFGLTIYVLFRPTTLLMFHWADLLGMTSSIDTMRAWVDGFEKHLPTWVVYSLPFALWVSSYLFFVKGLWWNSTSLIRHVWFWCFPVTAIAVELMQDIGIVSGRFDRVDLTAIILGTILGFVAMDFGQLDKGETK